MPKISLTIAESRKLQSCQVLFQRRHAYMAAAVLELGKIHFEEECRTAAILANGPNIILLFNRDFFDHLTVVQLAAVLIHETLHFVFAHPKRIPMIRSLHERGLFSLACEAVINDLIIANFPDLPLPCEPITGMSLVNQDTVGMTADEVMFILKDRVKLLKADSIAILSSMPLDEHARWEEEDDDDDQEGAPLSKWDKDSSLLGQKLIGKYGASGAFGNMPLGQDRLKEAAEQHATLDLSRFLVTAIRQSAASEYDWTRPNRRIMSLDTGLILPSDKLREHRSILIAIDASGSIPDHFLSAARSVAEKRIQNTEIELVSFDTQVYQFNRQSRTIKGGGGTSMQAVEDYALKKRRYPDMIIVFTDGGFDMPKIREPELWLWILPPNCTTKAIPAGGKIVTMPNLM